MITVNCHVSPASTFDVWHWGPTDDAPDQHRYTVKVEDEHGGDVTLFCDPDDYERLISTLIDGRVAEWDQPVQATA